MFRGKGHLQNSNVIIKLRIVQCLYNFGFGLITKNQYIKIKF